MFFESIFENFASQNNQGEWNTLYLLFVIKYNILNARLLLFFYWMLFLLFSFTEQLLKFYEMTL